MPHFDISVTGSGSRPRLPSRGSSPPRPRAPAAAPAWTRSPPWAASPAPRLSSWAGSADRSRTSSSLSSPQGQSDPWNPEHPRGSSVEHGSFLPRLFYCLNEDNHNFWFVGRNRIHYFFIACALGKQLTRSRFYLVKLYILYQRL